MQYQDSDLSLLNDIKEVLRETLELGDRPDQFHAETLLLGGLPELDSMAVVSLVHALEEKFGITIDGDEIDAETFETIGSVLEFIKAKTS